MLSSACRQKGAGERERVQSKEGGRKSKRDVGIMIGGYCREQEKEGVEETEDFTEKLSSRSGGNSPLFPHLLLCCP